LGHRFDRHPDERHREDDDQDDEDGKGLSMTLFHQSFRQVEDRSQRRPATHGSTLESKPGAAVAARVLLSAVRIVDNDTTFS
jgi:hypothetical protein